MMRKLRVDDDDGNHLTIMMMMVVVMRGGGGLCVAWSQQRGRNPGDIISFLL